MCYCLCVGKWMGGSAELLRVGVPRRVVRAGTQPLLVCVCVLMWLQDCCEAALVSLACQLTPSALHMKGPGCVGGQEKERGGPGMAVYLSPPCRNLYCTLSALIKDHSVALARSAPLFSLLLSLSY